MDEKTETRHSELPLSLAQKQGLFLLLLLIGGERKRVRLAVCFVALLSFSLKAFLFNGDDEQCIPVSPPSPTFLMPSFFAKEIFLLQSL